MKHDNGTGSTQSEISLVLTREHLGAKLTCKINSTALDTPFYRSVHVNMDLVPASLEMVKQVPMEGHKAGDRMTVTCIAKGAKPEAKIYWNSEPPLNMNDTFEEYDREPNGWTFTTANRLTFKAQRQLTSLSCFAYNKVLAQRKGVHLKRATTINVKYKPEIEQKMGMQVINAIRGEPVIIECRFKANPMHGVRVQWYKDGYKIIKGGERQSSEEGSSLTIEAEEAREGTYSCTAENEVGTSNVVDVAILLVESQPIVSIRIDPSNPVSEKKSSNVTLICEQRNQKKTAQKLIGVKWYLDGELLKHVERDPSCVPTADTHCNLDPSKIIFVNVRRSFHGNYSCNGRNRAGWGKKSPSKELKVLYAPSNATVRHQPEVIVKNKPFQVNK